MDVRGWEAGREGKRVSRSVWVQLGERRDFGRREEHDDVAWMRPDLPEPLDVIQESVDPYLNELNPVIVGGFIKKMMGGKSPGMDGITSEFLKCALEALEDAPMLRAVTEVVKHSYDHALVYDGWKETIVSPVPKKGDPSNLENYRGIALISNLQKIISSFICKMILEKAVMTRTCLEQAGFRSREEAVGQAVSLFQMAEHRSRLGLPTYLAFIDLEKAYDSVPHEALLLKLELFGLRGKAFSWIKACYQDARISSKMPDGRLSSSRPYARGVRQGDPLSPYLFNIFINDAITPAMRELGVPIRGTEALNHGTPERVCALMFADDIVFVAESIENVETLLAHFERWCLNWDMRMNVKKCAIMEIPDQATIEIETGEARDEESILTESIVLSQSDGSEEGSDDNDSDVDFSFSIDEDDSSVDAGRPEPAPGISQDAGPRYLQWRDLGRRAARESDKPLPKSQRDRIAKLQRAKISVQGELIPVTNSYTYLGVHFDSHLNRGAMIKDRALKALLSARDLYPTLANPTVPIAVQSMMIKAVISPCATYGGEVFGMNVAGLCPIRILLASTHEPSIKPSPSLIYESLSRSTGLLTLEHASS